MVAVRDRGGVLRVMASRRDGFALREWLAADGDVRTEKDALAEGVRCDTAGCVARLPDGRTVALALTADGVLDDCETAAFVVTARNAPPTCAAPIIDRDAARNSGAMAVWRDGRGFVLNEARPRTYARPWTSARPADAAPSSRPATPQDATPRASDLEADDGASIPAE
jgi:competence protein ComEC